MINPIEHSDTKQKAEQFKIEPYIIPADVYGNKELLGRGGWNWYTGSSGWYFTAGIQYILGFNLENKILKINPCIPSKWEEYFIQYRYGESIYNIKVNNIFKGNEVKKFIFNGEEIKEKQIKIIDDGKINNIEIIL